VKHYYAIKINKTLLVETGSLNSNDKTRKVVLKRKEWRESDSVMHNAKSITLPTVTSNAHKVELYTVG